MQSTTSSPVITHFSETLSGTSTIRTYNKEEFYIDQNVEKVNLNIKASFWLAGINQWFNIRLTLVSMIVTVSMMISCIIFRKSINPLEIGIMMNYIVWI
jgi:ATP-binding cassette, subfamily C (CFTR/MRP), member 2